MSVRALEYAEQQLGVHAVYNDATSAVVRLNETLRKIDKARSEKRRLEEQILDAEAHLLIEKRSKHPDMSEAQFKSQYNAWRRTDVMLVDLRSNLMRVSDEMDSLQSLSEVIKHDIRVRTARLEELGGYLQYLAAIKAEQTSQTIQPNQPNQT